MLLRNARASSTGVTKGHDRYVSILSNTWTLSAGVNTEDKRVVCDTKYDGGIICRSGYMR